MSRIAESSVIDTRFGTNGAALASITAHRLGVDGRIRCGICIAADAVGERRVVLFALFILFVEVSDRIAFAALSAFVFTASDMGSFPRFANCKDEARPSVDIGTGDNRLDDPCVERGRALVERAAHEFELGAEFARVVSRGDGAPARWQAYR